MCSEETRLCRLDRYTAPSRETGSRLGTAGYGSELNLHQGKVDYCRLTAYEREYDNEKQYEQEYEYERVCNSMSRGFIHKQANNVKICIRAIGAYLIVPLQAIEIQAKSGVRDLPKAQEKDISNLTQGKWLYKGYHSPRLLVSTFTKVLFCEFNPKIILAFQAFNISKLPTFLLVLLTIAPRLINVEAFPVDVVFRDVGGQQIDNGNKDVNTSSAARIVAITDKKDALTSVATKDPLGDADDHFDKDGALTSYAIMSGPLGDAVYVSPQIDKLVLPHMLTEYQEVTSTSYTVNQILLLTQDIGYNYSHCENKNEDFVMGIPKAKLSQIGLRVWCAPRVASTVVTWHVTFVCLTPFIEDKSTYIPSQGCTKNSATPRWDKELPIIDWPKDLRMPFSKPTTGNAEVSALSSFTTEEVTGKGKEKEGDSGCHPLLQWVKELFTLLPLI
ncbi:hypothetical protein EV359DRAFT_60318 [Lentinula novae-zelandiae]|nr:hypothetical protein EV359DRAFT_60318 [Lentinula novae-zelandiae]